MYNQSAAKSKLLNEQLQLPSVTTVCGSVAVWQGQTGPMKRGA